jgi:hypothetical protein
MFRHSETLASFGLTAFQSVFAVKCIQDYWGLGMLYAVFIGVVIAFVASCLEMTLVAKLLERDER